jgi:hypothetical protein
MERVWLSRLRWRRRGAWQWPAFAVLTVVDAVIVHELPLAGDRTAGWIPALLLAAFFNLIAVGVFAPLAGAFVRRRRADLPAIVARDRAGTTALMGVTVVLLAVGLAHRPDREAHREQLGQVSLAVRRYVAHQAQPRYRSHIDEITMVRLGDIYRSCVPGGVDGRSLCLFVDPGQSPPGIRVDPNPAPNATFVHDFVR